MAKPEFELAGPCEESKRKERGRAFRLVSASAALLACAGIIAVVLFSSSASRSALESARLAFGDGSFQPSGGSSSREGSVRNGQRPDFQPPIGSLGSEGLKQSLIPHGQQLSLAHTFRGKPQLAFGDADGFKPSGDPAAREGGVRNGQRPDYRPPMGDLGEVGLAHGTATGPAKQALAFGDASFHASNDPGMREGSVRHGKRPDFQPPLGGLGETGLAQKHDQAMGAVAAREAVDAYFDEQAAAIKRLEHKAQQPLVTSVVAHAQLTDFFDKLQERAQDEHASVMSQQVAHEHSSTSDMNQYFASIKAKDTEMHQAALKRVSDENAQMHALEQKEARKELHGAEPEKQQTASQEGSKKETTRKSKLRATTEALALSEGLGSIFDSPKANKHGFHPAQMARASGIKQQLKLARMIAKKDLDDCAFTLC